MPCTVHGCPEPAGWTVTGRPHCRAHMLDAVLATGLGTVTAVRSPPEPEPQADIVERLRLTDAEREAIEAAACICEDAGRTDIAIVINAAMDRLGGGDE
jgi:hypothetical protein